MQARTVAGHRSAAGRREETSQGQQKARQSQDRWPGLSPSINRGREQKAGGELVNVKGKGNVKSKGKGRGRGREREEG